MSSGTSGFATFGLAKFTPYQKFKKKKMQLVDLIAMFSLKLTGQALQCAL
jgi:hypothetical protein